MHQTPVSIGILMILSPGFIFGKILMPRAWLDQNQYSPGVWPETLLTAPEVPLSCH